MRRIFCILSPRSLPYASSAIESLFGNALEPLDVRFITDSSEDRKVLTDAVAALPNPRGHAWTVADQNEAMERGDEQFRGYPHLKAFQRGHPCWRKITDPPLFCRDGEEAIILDPDLYFPNRFLFEETPSRGILLMWQRPNCMYPPETVRAAYDIPVRLAHHVDIGVAHVRAPLDLEWLDWFLGRLGGAALPRSMHVESITWSALGMKQGGGYLDRRRWLCWHRTQWKRLRLRLGATGVQILGKERLADAKCFHAGGQAKEWLADARKAGILDHGRTLDQPSPVLPFAELTRGAFRRERALKGTLRFLGYYGFGKKSY